MVLSLTDGAVTDEHVARVLRPFVRVSRPVLGWVAAGRAPSRPGWAGTSMEQRTEWWLGRMGRLTALLAAVPGLGGALADRLPVQDALGAAGQGLLLCALAGEHGVRREEDQVRLLAAVLFDRDLDAAVLATADRRAGRRRDPGRPDLDRPDLDRPDLDRPDLDRPEVDRQAAELAVPLHRSQRRHGRFTLRAIAGTMWRLGRLLWGLGDELGKRPQGRWYHKLVGMLPVVGMAGDYLSERSALRKAARAGRRWLATHEPTRTAAAGD
jgi:hypothetical protein